ncbi:MAG: GNAT family N-acetyltransferase [Frankiales bacterium]|nr:GNAT family N-acetyltransferase [Frankiales bacterium]
MTDPSALRPARPPDVEATLVLARRPAPELSRFLYRAVGGDWYWLDRIDWTLDQWTDWVRAPGHQLWTCWVDGTPAGYAELHPDSPGSLELAYFGLLPGYSGLGLGGWLLTEAVQRAWSTEGTRRVWLHTCELDAPAALHNYRARGFVECGSSVELWDTREPSPGPWRGARGPAASRPQDAWETVEKL